MAPRGRRPSHPHYAQPSRAMKEAMEATKSYKEYLPSIDKVKMTELEDDVHLLREFHDEEEVKAQVGSLIPYLGCSWTHNTKFYRTLELYWHTKTMVSMGMLPKEQDSRQLKNRQEALEIQTPYMYEVVTSIASHHGGNFSPSERNYAKVDCSKVVIGREVVDLTVSQVPNVN